MNVVVRALIVVLLAGSVSAQRRQCGHVIYEVPAHWELGRLDDYQVIYSDDDEVGYYATIHVHRGFELNGTSPEAALRERMTLVLDEDEDAKQMGGLQESQLGRARALFAGELIDDRRMRLHALFVSRGWAFHNYLDARIKQDGIENVASVFSAFNEPLSFTTDGATPLLGAPTPGELSGAFAGTTQTYGLNGLEFGIGVYQFSTSGRFYEGTPIGGSLKTIRPDDVLFRFPDECGNYTVTGDTIELRYATGEVETMEFAVDGKDNLELDGVTYVRLDAVRDNARFDGKYRDFNYASFKQGSGVTGGVASERTITLTPDGRWEATRFSGAFGNFDNGTGDTAGGFATSSGRPAERGTYEIKDEVLVLTDETGLVSHKSILQMDGLLLLDGTTYLRND